jgi:hypothetical protein
MSLPSEEKKTISGTWRLSMEEQDAYFLDLWHDGARVIHWAFDQSPEGQLVIDGVAWSRVR